MTRARSQAGFTLLELLVALVVFGFIMVGLTAGLRFGTQAVGRQAAMMGADGGLDAADRAIRRLITGMEPGRRDDGTVITGDARSLRFVTELPQAAAALGEARAAVALLVENGDLVVRWAPQPRGAPPAAVTRSVLLRGVAGLRLEYLSGDGSWVGAWNGHAPPRLVRLRLAFPPGDARSWPEMIAAPARG